MYYQPMSPENMLSRRNVWGANLIGLGLIWVAFMLRIVSLDANVLKVGDFLVITGAVFAAVVNLAAALGSKRTSDMQNLGLLVWTGFLVTMAVTALAYLRIVGIP
jgi:hypothetical protein